MRDLGKYSKFLGAKIWWHSMSHKEDPWEKLWHSKYAHGKPKKDLIRFNEGCKDPIYEIILMQTKG